MNNYTFQIDNVVVPFMSAVDFSQEYDYITATTKHRTMDGTGILQGTYSKIKTTLTGRGVFPLGLSDLDQFAVHTLYCGAPRAITTPLPSKALPTDRRTDAGYEPTAMALFDDGRTEETAVTMTGNVANCDVVEGASAYRISYYPKLQVFIEPPKENTELRGANFGWSLTCEEV